MLLLLLLLLLLFLEGEKTMLGHHFNFQKSTTLCRVLETVQVVRMGVRVFAIVISAVLQCDTSTSNVVEGQGGFGVQTYSPLALL